LVPITSFKDLGCDEIEEEVKEGSIVFLTVAGGLADNDPFLGEFFDFLGDCPVSSIEIESPLNFGASGLRFNQLCEKSLFSLKQNVKARPPSTSICLFFDFFVVHVLTFFWQSRARPDAC
jgi:hypothetical protein